MREDAHHGDAQVIFGSYEDTWDAVIRQVSQLEKQLMRRPEGLKVAAIKHKRCNVTGYKEACWVLLQLLHLRLLHLSQDDGCRHCSR